MAKKNIISQINYPILLDAHFHPLVYCYTKNRPNFGDSWRCNKCEGIYTYDIPSCYCTYCDFDLCLSCLEQYKLNQVLSYDYTTSNNFMIMNDPSKEHKWDILFPCHNHLLTLIQKINQNYSWFCNNCSNNYSNSLPFYYCSLCNFCLCQICANKYSQNLNMM